MALKCSRILMVLILLVCVKAYKRCRTLNGDEGACVEFQKCPTVFDRQNNSVFYNQEKNFLIDSYCGWWSMPKVCCGRSYTYTNRYRMEIEKYNTTCGNKKDIDIRWLVKLNGNCYGFLITNRYIVGRASCMDNIRTVEFVHQRTSMDVLLVTKHPLADIKQEYYDIALIKLRNTVQYNPICVNLETEDDTQPTSHIQDVGSKFWIVDPNNLKGRNFTASTVKLCQNNGFKSIICSGPCSKRNNEFSILVSEDFSHIEGLTTTCHKNLLTSINIWYFQSWIASNIR